MNITILGASAGVGLEITKQALQKNHTITTLSRSALQIPDANNLIMIQGSVLDKPSLKQSIQNAEAIVVALGTGKSTKATTLYTDFARVLLEIHHENPINVPVVILTGFGAGNSSQYQSAIMRFLFSMMLKKVYQNKTEMESLISNSDLQWIMVRPGMLTNKPLSKSYQVITSYYTGMKIGSISRADVASYMLQQAEKPDAIGMYPALG